MHQSLKLLRDPCATAGISSLRNMAVNTMSDNGFPRKPGNTNSEDPSANFSASRSTSIDLLDSGTWCSRRAFIRSAGTVHLRSRQLISSQVASLTSRLRAAVNTRNSNANSGDRVRRGPPDFCQCCWNFAVVQRRMVALGSLDVFGNTLVIERAGGIVGPITLCDDPIKNRFHALTYPTCRLGLFHPYRRQDA